MGIFSELGIHYGDLIQRGTETGQLNSSYNAIRTPGCSDWSASVLACRPREIQALILRRRVRRDHCKRGRLRSSLRTLALLSERPLAPDVVNCHP